MITTAFATSVNVLMGIGIVGFLFAIRDINRSNTLLHESNLRDQACNAVLFGGSDEPARRAQD